MAYIRTNPDTGAILGIPPFDPNSTIQDPTASELLVPPDVMEARRDIFGGVGNFLLPWAGEQLMREARAKEAWERSRMLQPNWLAANTLAAQEQRGSAKPSLSPKPPPPPSPLPSDSGSTEQPNPIQVVMRDGKPVFLTANRMAGGDKLGNIGQEAAKLRSMGIAKAMYEGRDYTGNLGEMTPGNVPRVVPISSMRVGAGEQGPSSSMMQIAAGPQMDIGKELALRELESQQIAEAQAKAKTGIAEAAKPPAQQVGEIATAKEKGQTVGGIQGYIQGEQEVLNNPLVVAAIAKADTDLKIALDSIDPKLSPSERAKAEAEAKAGHALRVQTIKDNAWNKAAAPQKVLGPGYELAGTPRS
jgi:hypothetical protein